MSTDLPAADLPAIRVTAPTEESNPRSRDLDRLSTAEIVQLINHEDAAVAGAVAGVLDEVARLVDIAVTALRGGGRVHYFGAGTSGRLAVLDAVELPPTFNAPGSWFCPHLAGGAEAVWHAVEGAEDDAAAGQQDAAACVRPGDVAVGLTASGRTPYVLAALAAAAEAGALTALITANPGAGAAGGVHVFIAARTGPEVVTGSTRMKAATAQKLVLNTFSTAVMVRLGRVYSNFMISVAPTNAKLRGRMISILMEATGCAEPDCHRALADADGDLKTALVALLAGAAVVDARRALRVSDGQVRPAVAMLSPRA